MLTRAELAEHAKLNGLSLGNAEKDYLLELTLLLLSRHTGSELVFKGGTALSKCYGLDRFSEDLDFTVTQQLDVDALVDQVIRGLQQFQVPAAVHSTNANQNSVELVLRTQGPLYTGNPQSLSKVVFDFNLSAKVYLPSVTTRLPSIYRDIPRFSIQVMSLEEIFTEKVRAIYTRKKARDIYDLWFLTSKLSEVDVELIHKKLEYYQLRFSVSEFAEKIDDQQRSWQRDLQALVPQVPVFKEVKIAIVHFFEGM